MCLIKYVIASGLGCGYAPLAPGTAGSLLAVAIFWLWPLNSWIWLTIIILVFFIGVWAATGVEREKGNDPGLVVIDEVVGQWISYLFLPVSLFNLIAGFFLFRLFDIFKPFPIDQSQKLKGGWGIMIDDVLAGIYANVLLQIVLVVGKFI